MSDAKDVFKAQAVDYMTALIKEAVDHMIEGRVKASIESALNVFHSIVSSNLLTAMKIGVIDTGEIDKTVDLLVEDIRNSLKAGLAAAQLVAEDGDITTTIIKNTDGSYQATTESTPAVPLVPGSGAIN